MKQQAHNQYSESLSTPPEKPPDPIQTIKVSFKNYDSDHSTSSINQKYSINNIVHSASKRSITNSRNGTLIDWGANGGLAGNNIKVFNNTGRKGYVQVTDNHQITDTPIVTIAGVINTQCGDMILIMH